jgi:2-polyprenyl-6-methoxyphenol hydroxylase-like FAD-dependent oxidoreductase
METVEVVVVGAGPAGLSAAVAVARVGLECLVVERRRDPSSLPRATVVSTRSMELLRSWGLEDEVRAGGDEVEWLLWECETLARAATGRGHEVGYPTAGQATMVSPTAPACVPQDHLERVLVDHVRSFAGARVEFGTEVVAIANDTDGVRVTLRAVDSGEQRVARSKYVIAADGAHSTVRDLLGIAMLPRSKGRSGSRGTDAEHDSLMVQFRAPVWNLVGPHRYGIYWITDPVASGTMLPAGGDRWLYGIEWDADDASSDDEFDSRLVRRIRAAAGRPDLDVRIEQKRTFAFAAQLADRWRDGRVFLVGDAAHRVTPRGGTGMNTAMAGGFDLGWKLAWVLNGWSHASLLDSYESDRRPMVEHNVDRSIDPFGSRRSVLPELQVDLAGRMPHAWLPSSHTSTLDLVDCGLTLFTAEGSGWTRAVDAVDVRVPLTLRELDTITARAIGVFRTGALVVRPDGAPIGLWYRDDDAVEQLESAVRVVTAAATDRRLARDAA